MKEETNTQADDSQPVGADLQVRPETGAAKATPLQVRPETGAAKATPLQPVAELETALGEAKKSLDVKTGECDRLKAALDDAVSAYRRLAVSASPLYSDDVISGGSIEEIDASIKKINGLVKKMRSSLEAELRELTIPAGAPERSAPDTSGLSPREKIKQGLDRK